MAILRSVAKTDTFEIQRQKINQIATDLFNVQTSVGEGAFSMSDGSVQQPSLYFTNANDVGIYRGSSGKQLFIGAEGSSVAKFDKDYLTSLQNFRTFRSPIATQGGITISNSGSGYNIGTYPKVNLSGGNGSGATAEVVTSIVGDFTNAGSGYVFGSYQLVPLTGGSGTGMQATISVERFIGTIAAAGTGGTPGLYSGVTLTGGTGTGVVADILVSALGQVTGVAGVTITSFGSGYQIGQILSASSGSIGGVSGFQFELTNVGEISSIIVTNAGSGYNTGDVLSVNNSNLGGSGAGLQYTITSIGALTDITITNGGDNYVVGDQLTITQTELAQLVTYHVKLLNCQLFEFSPPLPANGFNVGDTITYNGDQAPIVKRFLDNSGNIEAITTEVQNFAFMSLVPATTMDDGNGNIATPSSVTNALNYFFSSTGANGNYTNIPDFTFQKNVRYLFDQSDPTNVGHPLRFSTTPDGFHTVIVPFPTDYGDEYNGPDVDYGYAANTVSLAPNDDTPTTLYYYCGAGIEGGNAHLDEGGFDGREGAITISGEVPLIGSGIVLSVASIVEETNILLNKDGTATFKNTSVQNLSVSGDTTLQSDLLLSGDLIIGSNKFVVEYLTGDTVIDGGLSVSGDLAFLSDASFGSTLYVDSVNNKVSVNIDPAVTPLTADLEVSGSLMNSGDVDLATDQASYVRIGDGLSGSQKLQVQGDIFVFNGKVISPAEADVTNPSYTFAGNSRLGLSGNGTNNSLSITSISGETSRFKNDSITFYRDLNLDYVEITETSITQSGEGYTEGSFSGVATTGGTGEGLIASIIIAFYCPIGEIVTVNNISAADTDRIAGTYTVDDVFYTTSGDGINAEFEIVVDGVGDCSVTVLNGGEKFVVGETITIPGSVLSPGALTPASNLTFDIATLSSEVGAGYTDATFPSVSLTGGSGTGAIADITIENGSVKEFVVIDSGENYEVGDVVSFDYTSLSFTDGTGQIITSTQPSTPASFTIKKFGAVTKVTIQVTGEGYANNDVLTFPNLAGEFTEEAQLTIVQTNAQTNVSINNETGKITSQSLDINGSGINLNQKLTLVNNTISSIANEDIVITPGSSQKLLSVSGTGGVKIPVGTSLNRPSASTLGIIRYNSSTQQYEGSNGSDFISLGGVRDVDGNTYILAEEFVGANDNTLYFVTDNTNTARLTTGELTLITANTIASRDIAPPKTEWEAGASAVAATLPEVNYIYYGDNLYSVDTSGTFDTDENNAPAHTSGTVTNGSVDLTYVGPVFGPLTIKASNITLDATLTLSGLDIYSYANNNLILDNSLDTTQFAFGKQGGVPDTILTITDFGQLQINKQFGTANAADNLTVLDKTLKFIDLDDLTIRTNTNTLERGVSDIASFILYNPTLYTSAKVVVVADNTTTDDRHMVEYSVISKGSDIFVVEYADINTGTELFTSTFDFESGGSVRINPTLLTDVTPGDFVNITVTSTLTKK